MSKTSNILFIFFIFLFFTGMSCSKLIHPLWFEQNDALMRFGFGYAVMAFSGMFSVIYGAFIEKIGPNSSIKLGCFLYGVGMFLRIYTNSYLIITISALISGIGASMVILCLRYWIVSLNQESSRITIISIKNIVTSLGLASGAFLGGFLLIFDKQIGLIVAAFIPVLSIFILNSSKISFLQKDKVKLENNNISKYLNILKKDYSLALALFVFSSIAGFSTSFIVPYLPLIYTKMGINKELIGGIVASCAIASGITQILLKNQINKYDKKILFIIFETIFALCTIFIAIKMHLAIFIIIIVVRAFISSVSKVLQEMIEIELINNAHIPIFFGIIQSAFLFGDMLGGAIAAYAYSNGHFENIIIIASLLILLNAFTLPFFGKWRERTASQE